jgi:molybdate transport system substrate-binding protein
MNRRQILAFVATAIVAVVLAIAFNLSQNVSPVVTQQQTSLTVSAAISLTNALQEIKTLYQQQEANVTITYNFGASGALQQQIEQGAPADIFFSAGVKQIEALQQKNLLISETRKNPLTNRLVLITPKNSTALTDFRQLTNSKVKRIAIGEPRSVPAGQYAKELLTNMGIYDQIQSKFIYGTNVRQVLSYVETGNVDAGIVYTTDAKESKQVRQAVTAPANLHSPIVYPVAVLKRTRRADAAKAFVQFLSSNKAKAVFEKYGFGIAD